MAKLENSLPVVNPIWPLLATMLGGVWMGWTWFAINAVALEGERRSRQFAALAVGVVVLSVAAIATAVLHGKGTLEEAHLKYVGILLTAGKLAVAYQLVLWQRRECQLFEYYGGSLRNGMWLALSGILLRGFVVGKLIPAGWWTLVIS